MHAVKQSEGNLRKTTSKSGSLLGNRGGMPFFQPKRSVNTLDPDANSVSDQVMRINNGGALSIQRQVQQNFFVSKSISGGDEMIEALKKTSYGNTLFEILKNSDLEYKIKIKSYNDGKMGAPKKIEKNGLTIGYELNFQKYDKVELAGTRYDHASKDEYYGGIFAHDIIDIATPNGIEITKKKEADMKNKDSDYSKSLSKWQSAKKEEKEAAKNDFFEYLINNYEKIGLDAEYKFRDQFSPHTLDTPIGELSQGKKLEGNNPNLTGKTPREIYTKGIR